MSQITIFGMNYLSFSNILKLISLQIKKTYTNVSDSKLPDKYNNEIKIIREYIKNEETDIEYIHRIQTLNNIKNQPKVIQEYMTRYMKYLNNLISNQCNILCEKISDSSYYASTYYLCKDRCLNIDTFISNFLEILEIKKTNCESTYANMMGITTYSTTYLISKVYLSIKDYLSIKKSNVMNCEDIISDIIQKLINRDIFFLDLYVNALINLAKTQRRYRKLYNLLFFNYSLRPQTAGKYKHKQLKRNFRTLKNKIKRYER